MRAEYLAEDFIENTEPTTKKEQIDKKVSLLYDLCILHEENEGLDQDQREKAVRELLASYGSEIAIDNAVHDVVVGKCTLDDMLERKGF